MANEEVEKMKNEAIENKKSVPKSVYPIVTVIFLISLLFAIPNSLRTLISSNLASYRAQNRLESISIPSEIRVIDMYNAGYVTSNSCYSGRSYLLIGTHLDKKEVGKFYINFFSSWNWEAYNRWDSNSYLIVSGPEKTGWNRSIEGVSIMACDEECVSSHNFDEAAIQGATEEYESLYLIGTHYLPYEMRENLCWCCSGG